MKGLVKPRAARVRLAAEAAGSAARASPVGPGSVPAVSPVGLGSVPAVSPVGLGSVPAVSPVVVGPAAANPVGSAGAQVSPAVARSVQAAEVDSKVGPVGPAVPADPAAGSAAQVSPAVLGSAPPGSLVVDPVASPAAAGPAAANPAVDSVAPVSPVVAPTVPVTPNPALRRRERTHSDPNRSGPSHSTRSPNRLPTSNPRQHLRRALPALARRVARSHSWCGRRHRLRCHAIKDATTKRPPDGSYGDVAPVLTVRSRLLRPPLATAVISQTGSSAS